MYLYYELYRFLHTVNILKWKMKKYSLVFILKTPNGLNQRLKPSVPKIT